MDLTQTVLQSLANKVGKLEVENTCLSAELQVMQEQLKKLQEKEEDSD